jgi:hypothetical protein
MHFLALNVCGGRAPISCTVYRIAIRPVICVFSSLSSQARCDLQARQGIFSLGLERLTTTTNLMCEVSIDWVALSNKKCD